MYLDLHLLIVYEINKPIIIIIEIGVLLWKKLTQKINILKCPVLQSLTFWVKIFHIWAFVSFGVLQTFKPRQRIEHTPPSYAHFNQCFISTQ